MLTILGLLILIKNKLHDKEISAILIVFIVFDMLIGIGIGKLFGIIQ